MGIFGKFKQDTSVTVTEVDRENYQSFSTPFLKVPESNLSLPFVDARRQQQNIIRFGDDNMYPQYLNQMYYTSPLHGSICEFKKNVVCGGGYEILDEGLNVKEKVDLYAFEKRMKFRKNLQPTVLDLIVHGRVYFILTLKKGALTRIERIGAEKVRTNKDKSIYSVNQDWQYVSEIRTYTPYHPECKDGVYIYVYEKTSLGQDIYPLPSYTSAMNWIFLDGEMSYLHKSNIQNSVFPAFMMMFPKKFQSPEEMEMVKNTVENMKGAKNAGKTAIFSANAKDQLPEMVAVPTNNNDQLFIQTDGRIDEKICQSHQIDPLLMGIRVSGKLGSGMELPQLTQTFEKNVILPLREEVEEIFNDFLDIAGINAEFVCKEFQVIDEKIVDKTQTVKTEE